MFTAKRCLFVSACLASCQINALAFNPLVYQRSTALCSTVLRGEIPVKTEIDISEDFFVCLGVLTYVTLNHRRVCRYQSQCAKHHHHGAWMAEFVEFMV